MKINSAMTKNIVAFIILPFLIGFINLFKMRFFIQYLGSADNGIYQFYAQFFSFFTLIEVGLETAVYTSLFKYLVNKDYNQINRVVKGARIYWRRIGYLTLFLGILCLPLGPLMIKESSILMVVIIQLLYTIRITLNYFFAGPQAVAMADNKGYMIITIDSITLTLTSICTIILAIVTKNLALIVLFELFAMLLAVIFKFHYVKKKFPWLDFKIKNEPSFEFKSFMKGTSIIKVTDMIINNTDLTIVMLLLGAVASSNFSIYNNFAILLIMIFSTSLISSFQSYFGKIFVDKALTENTKIEYTKKLKILNFSIITLVLPIIMMSLNIFIGLFYGKSEMQDSLFYIIFISFMYFKMIRTPYSTLKVSLGRFNQFSRIAMINAVVNIVLSLTFTYFFGLVGVLIGTIVAYIATELWYEIMIFDVRFSGENFTKIIVQLSVHYLATLAIGLGLLTFVTPFINGYFSLIGLSFVVFIIFSTIFTLFLYWKVSEVRAFIEKMIYKGEKND